MATKAETAPVCEVIGVFHTADDLESAIDELLRSGFDRAELSLLANEDAIRKKLGRHYRSVGEMAEDTEVPRAAFVSTEAIGDADFEISGGKILLKRSLRALAKFTVV